MSKKIIESSQNNIIIIGKASSHTLGRACMYLSEGHVKHSVRYG
ncbi:MAG: hypothetical protein AMXMBFR12_07270 [Candidatus Babeliales bacterium]